MLKERLTVANLLYKGTCVGYRLFSVNKDFNDNLDVYDVSKDVGDAYNLSILSDRDILLIPDGKLLISRDEIDNHYVVTDITENIELLDSLLSNVSFENYSLDCDANDNSNTVFEILEELYNNSMENNLDSIVEDEVNDIIEEDEVEDFILSLDNENEDNSDDYDEVVYYSDDAYIDLSDNNEDLKDNDFIDLIDDMYNDDEDNEELNFERNEIVTYLCGLYLKPSRLMKFKTFLGIPVNLELEIGNELKKSSSSLTLEDISNCLITRMEREGYCYKSSDEFFNGMTEGTFIQI